MGRTNEEWKNWGYTSKESCCVCGSTNDTKVEPRFGYTICKEHSTIAPSELHLYTKKE